MLNPIYQKYFGGGAPVQGTSPSFSGQSAPMGMNPMQKMMTLMQAMANPIAFIKQRFPDIPANIQHDPNQVFNYLQHTRNPVSNQQIQEAQQMKQQIIGEGNVR